MKYKLLVLDVDGTLMTSDKRITEVTREAIFDVQRHGVFVAIASGRCTAGIMPTAKAIGLDQYGGFIVSYNGASAYNCKTGEVPFSICLPKEIIPEIYEFSREYKTGIMTYYKNVIVTENEADQYIQIDAKGCSMEIQKVQNFAESVIYPVNKCLLTGEPSHMERVEPCAAKAFEGRLSVYRSEDFYVEMMPLGVDKSYGLEHLLQILGLTRQEMICCGDGFNDISMIKGAGLGVAMANAHEAVKKEADYIAPGCDEDGLVDVIEKFIKDW